MRAAGLAGFLRALLDVGRVQVDVLLTRQPHELVHHLVDHGALDEPVARQPLEAAKSMGLPNFTWTRPNRHILLPGGLTTSVPTIATGITGTPVSQCDARQSGLALVEPTVGRTGALGVHAEQLALAEDALGGGQRGLRGVGVGAVDGHLAGDRVEPAGEPALDARCR